MTAEKNAQTYGKWGAGLAIGIAVGVALGVSMGNIGLGIGIGLAIGIAFGLAFQGTQKKKNQDDEPKID
jgi:hypothetical protein